ncbi:DUF7667 family protein [Brevibacillus borstelensis]|uniref:DUF7667 family protein n=1 Tax=Brevibacillus borstelensis TaxID=45462 RepID=UPI0030C1E864
MSAVQKRLLVLVGILLVRPLTIEERRDLQQAHKYLVNREWKLGLLETQSYLASLTNDVEWQHKICKQIDALDGR